MTAVLLLLKLLLIGGAFAHRPCIIAAIIIAAGIAWAVVASHPNHDDGRLPRWPLSHEGRIA